MVLCKILEIIHISPPFFKQECKSRNKLSFIITTFGTLTQLSAKNGHPLTFEIRHYMRGLFHKIFLEGGNTMKKKILLRQNITYSLLCQIIKQTKASSGDFVRSSSQGELAVKQQKTAYFMKKNKSLLSPLFDGWRESLQLLLELQAKKEEIIASLRTSRRMLCTTDVRASLPNQALSHSTGCLGSKRRDANSKGSCAQVEEDCEMYGGS